MISNYSTCSYCKQKAMALVQPLQLGDRVRMIRTANRLVQGSYGTVVRVLSGSDCYDVQFENNPWLRLVYRAI